MKMYISGPMSNMPEHNFPAFNSAAKYLRGLGYDVINPAEINTADESKTWRQCMELDIVALVTCDTVVTLEGWENSRGANLEVHIGKELGMNIIPFTLVTFVGDSNG